MMLDPFIAAALPPARAPTPPLHAARLVTLPVEDWELIDALATSDGTTPDTIIALTLRKSLRRDDHGEETY